jgi:hypothetical protein
LGFFFFFFMFWLFVVFVPWLSEFNRSFFFICYDWFRTIRAYYTSCFYSPFFPSSYLLSKDFLFFYFDFDFDFDFDLFFDLGLEFSSEFTYFLSDSLRSSAPDVSIGSSIDWRLSNSLFFFGDNWIYSTSAFSNVLSLFANSLEFLFICKFAFANLIFAFVSDGSFLNYSLF